MVSAALGPARQANTKNCDRGAEVRVHEHTDCDRRHHRRDQNHAPRAPQPQSRAKECNADHRGKKSWPWIGEDAERRERQIHGQGVGEEEGVAVVDVAGQGLGGPVVEPGAEDGERKNKQGQAHEDRQPGPSVARAKPSHLAVPDDNRWGSDTRRSTVIGRAPIGATYTYESWRSSAPGWRVWLPLRPPSARSTARTAASSIAAATSSRTSCPSRATKRSRTCSGTANSRTRRSLTPCVSRWQQPARARTPRARRRRRRIPR